MSTRGDSCGAGEATADEPERRQPIAAEPERRQLTSLRGDKGDAIGLAAEPEGR
jgi:hypothetical protein